MGRATNTKNGNKKLKTGSIFYYFFIFFTADEEIVLFYSDGNSKNGKVSV